MRLIRKLPFFLLILTMLLASAIPAVAAPAERTTQEKAVVLGNLKIISGVNGEYYLDNPLRRSEAATFIVRVIGKGDYVNQNKSQYSQTPYSDVPSTEWYAPFIGYCYQNGLVFETSTQFKPLDFITEKEFMALVLGALDYRMGTDFTLDTVYDKAREIGLLSLTEYINRASVNPTTTRGSAVDILYKALTLNCRGGDQILLQKMIEAGIVTRLQAMAMGLIVDSVFTDIISVESLDLNRIQVIMNESISSVGEVLIYSGVRDDIRCSVDSIKDDAIVVVTDPLEQGKDYIIELHDVRDNQGNVTGKLMKQFQGFEVKEVASSFFRISRIEPVNQRSLKVYFTHPLSINSEICLYYTLSQNGSIIADGKQGRIRAGVLNSDDNGVLLSLDNDLLKEGEVYTLSIDGDMVSAYGAALNNGAGDSMKFVAREAMDTKFDLAEMVASEKNVLILNFNKEVNPFLARQVFNFYLTDAGNNPIPIRSTSIDANGHSIYLILGADLVKNNSYYLTINNLNDITKQEYITEKVYSFKAEYGSSSAFKLSSAAVLDNQTIELTFNKPLDGGTAADERNYSIASSSNSSGVRPAKVLFDARDRYKVRLYLAYSDRLQKQSTYMIRINSNSIKDYLGNGIEATSVQFLGTSKDREVIQIDEAVPVSTDAVKLTLSQELSYSVNNLIPANFVLEYSYGFISIKKIPVSVIYIDAKTLILKFDSLEYGTPYTLKVSELTDITGNVGKALEKSFSLKAQQ